MTEEAKIEKAWWNVNSLARSSDHCNESDHSDIELIEEIVKKAIPMKPILIGDYGKIYYELWSCPNCLNKYPSETGEYKYCPKCGQRIDWGEEEWE